MKGGGGRRADLSWRPYLDAFHAERPGITEAVLLRARARSVDPYQWLAETVPAEGTVLDLACGSAPMRTALPPGIRYLGLDRSPAELAAAQVRGAGPLVRADATALPLGTGTIDTAVCSMALMLFAPLPAVLAEIRRVLAPGGLLVATIPANRPPHASDLATAVPLLLALRRTLRYPNDHALRRPRAALAAAGFTLATDRRRRFAVTLDRPGDAELLLDSLYLPGLDPARRRQALRVLRRAADRHTEIPIPLRQIIARAR
ncbi:class I SAM-dependent methyltransferase [Kitasatospora hibisci]|uniref:class I SAM-dependent methyltransferase n=1 Tax=Kitasatospora hibisci TaxID=3369522 RepID=UPI003754EB7D